MSRRGLRDTIIGIAMIPLTALPIWLYVTRTDDGYLMYLRARYALAPPATPRLGPAEYRLAHAVVRQREAGVAVLLYHGIGRSSTDGGGARFVLSRSLFAEQMRVLRAAGYHAITCRALARYLVAPGQTRLPRKPILITFDDGRLDAILQADRILRDTKLRATMFVIAKRAEEGTVYYAQWGELHAYAKSGRWDLENHTYNLHSAQRVGRFSRSALATPRRGETLARYSRRIGADLDRAQKELGGAIAFAYPFGDWGEEAPERAARTLRAVLRHRFLLAFDQDHQASWRPALPGDDRMHIHRLEIEHWNGPELLRRLLAGSRRAAAVMRRDLGSRTRF
jgi:peptidoglycan/xylan/chitin deacetylase (PgdA/CDA1 family)